MNDPVAGMIALAVRLNERASLDARADADYEAQIVTQGCAPTQSQPPRALDLTEFRTVLARVVEEPIQDLDSLLAACAWAATQTRNATLVGVS